MGRPTGLLRGERPAFRIAAAVIVVHSLLHAFVFVRPGAARSGHLLAALVACGLVIAAAALYEHLGPGQRASLTLVLGATTLVAGAVAVVDATRGGSWVRRHRLHAAPHSHRTRRHGRGGALGVAHTRPECLVALGQTQPPRRRRPRRRLLGSSCR